MGWVQSLYIPYNKEYYIKSREKNSWASGFTIKDNTFAGISNDDQKWLEDSLNQINSIPTAKGIFDAHMQAYDQMTMEPSIGNIFTQKVRSGLSQLQNTISKNGLEYVTGYKTKGKDSISNTSSQQTTGSVVGKVAQLLTNLKVNIGSALQSVQTPKNCRKNLQTFQNELSNFEKEISNLNSTIESTKKALNQQSISVKKLGYNNITDFKTRINQILLFAGQTLAYLGIPSEKYVSEAVETAILPAVQEVLRHNRELGKDTILSGFHRGDIMSGMQYSQGQAALLHAKGAFTSKSYQPYKGTAFNTSFVTSENGVTIEGRSTKDTVDITLIRDNTALKNFQNQANKTIFNASVKAYQSPSAVKLIDSTPLTALLEMEQNLLFHYMNIFSTSRGSQSVKGNNNLIISERSSFQKQRILEYAILKRGLSGYKGQGSNTIQGNTFIFFNKTSQKWRVWSVQDLATKVIKNPSLLSNVSYPIFENSWAGGTPNIPKGYNRSHALYFKMHKFKLSPHINLNKI